MNNPFDVQVGGDHYKKLAIQPAEYALKNNLNAAQANVVKYVTRYKDKGQRKDLEKAKHWIDLLIAHEYGLEDSVTSFEGASHGTSFPVSREDQSASSGGSNSMGQSGDKSE